MDGGCERWAPKTSCNWGYIITSISRVKKTQLPPCIRPFIGLGPHHSIYYDRRSPPCGFVGRFLDGCVL